MIEPQIPRVLIDAPSWFVRPGNTDWRYMQGLVRLGERTPLRPVLMRDPRDAVQESWSHLSRRWRRASSPGRRVLGSDLEKCGAGVVLSHRRFPHFDRPVPVIWRHAILDPGMLAAAGHTDAHIEAEHHRLQPFFQAAAVVQVSTRAEAQRHAARFPELAHKFAYCPFFMPDLTLLGEDRARAKHFERGVVRLLFVGHEARRKGLPDLLCAVAALPSRLRARLRLDVVSRLRDGCVDLGGDFDVRLHRGVPPARVRALMAAAHIFVLPSRFESYGFVLVEALSQGCAVIGPDFEVQREILTDVGVTATSPETLRQALLHLIETPQHRAALAAAALARVRNEFIPQVAAARYLQLVIRAWREVGA